MPPVVPPGAPALGRGVVVLAGDEVPAPWRDAPVVVVDAAVLAAPGPVLRALHEAWAARRPVAVVLNVDPDHLRAPADLAAEPWTLAPDLEPGLERLQFLVWANTYDARGGAAPTWWWGRKAERLGAEPAAGAPGDVVLPDGRPAWVDGGPRAPLDPVDLGAEVVHRESVDLGSLRVAPPPRAPAAELAPDQRAAVAAVAGATRVLAPAGSGKTRVLTERLRHLLVDRDWEPELVLAVAYNVRAREELEERCVGLGARVQTLNSLGLSVLREARGRPPRVLSERDVRRELEGLVPLAKGRRRRANTDPLAPYLEGLTSVRLGLRDPAEVEAERDDVPGLAEAFPRYRAALADLGAVDFDEQVYGAVEALVADAGLRARLASRTRHLLVDEFQDLTPAHVLLLRLLALPGLEVFGVGDDDQVIYGYNGADPQFLLDYDELFPAAGSSPLEVNYRCPVAVVDGARTLLGYNRRRVAKAIRPGPLSDPEPGALRVDRCASERSAAALVEVVQGWLAEPGAAPDGVAVLARVASLLLAPTVALGEAGVPVASILGPEVLDRLGVRAALAYVRISEDPDRVAGADVLEVLRRPSRGLPPWFGDRVRRRARWSLPALRAVADAVPAKDAPKVHELVDDLEVVVAARVGGTTRDVLAAVREQVGLGRAMGLLDASKGGQVASQLDDLEALEQVAALEPDPGAFEPWLRAALARPAAGGGVTLSTIHRVKGREWDRVAVVGVTEGLLPHRLAEDVEEERRILHVAITRGRRRVAVLADAARPSPFLDELRGTAAQPAERPPAPARAVATTRRPTRGPEEPLPPEAARVEEALKAWRRGRARADGVAAFIVASNAVLRAVAEARPGSLEELASVPGIGPTKLELYGDELLAVVAEG